MSSMTRMASMTTIGWTREKVARQNAKDDDVRIGGARSVLMMLRVFSGITGYYVFSVAALVAWTCVCAWGADHLRERAGQDPGGRVEAWLGWIEEIEVKVIGSLFTFSLVFRFNQCYRRWWQGRELWGGIVQQCLDFSEKVSLWIIDKDYSDRLNRLIIVFPYACKAQLRGLSLADPTESGASLVRRGLLTEAELRYLDKWPCWQPEFFLDFMRTIISHVFLAEYDRGDVLMIPKSNKIHEKLFSPLEKCVYDLGKSIGDCISIRSAGLPKSYDFVHYVFYWLYFLLASVTWSVTIGWMAPVLVGLSSSIIMSLIQMGTCLCDPFGTDYTDLPLEKFCETIEAQIGAIQYRSKRPELMHFAETSSTGFLAASNGFDMMKSSHHIRL